MASHKETHTILDSEDCVVPPAADRIQPIANVPNWTESMLLQSHDSKSGHSYWAHWSRMPDAPSIWEGVIVLFTPSGEILVSRSFGSARRQDTADTGSLRLRCDEPLRRWTMDFNGMARRITYDDATRSPVEDGPVEYVSLEADFHGIHPTWSPTEGLKGQGWASAHLEQGGEIQSRLRYAGVDVHMASYGFRDHSYGPRDYGSVLGDAWVTAVFPSGRAFLALEIFAEVPGGTALAAGFTWDGSVMTPITDLALPRLTNSDASPRSFTFDLCTGSGSSQVQVEQTDRMNLTFERPTGISLGTRHDPQALLATEGPAKITWSGEEADGWIEKSLRLSELG